MRFTKLQAINICKRRLSENPTKHWTGYDCYYHNGKCELGYHCWNRCPSFVPDVIATNRVRKNILYNPKWVIDHWEELCQTDKELFEAIYDKKERMI